MQRCCVPLLLSSLVLGTALAAQDVRRLSITGTGAEVSLSVTNGEEHGAVSRDGGRTWTPLGRTDLRIRWRDRAFDLAGGDPALPGLLSANRSNQLYLVQFVTDIVPEYRTAIEALGGEIGHYVPNQAFIVRMSADVAEAVRRAAWVHAVGALHPFHKLDSPISVAMLAESLAPARYNLMLFDKQTDAPATEAAIRALGGRVELEADGGILVEATLTPEQLLEAAHLNTVVFIDRWSAPEFDIDNLRIQAGVNFLESIAGIDGKGMRGHILEGIHASHPEFGARSPYRTAPIAVLSGSSSSHGTNTAGEIYAQGLSPAHKGILPFAQLVYTNYSSVINTNNRYSLTRDLVNPALQYKVTFQTASWGYAVDVNYTSRSAEMDDILFDFDHLFVTNSQSNTGDQRSRPQAWAKNVAGVGGFRHNNNSDPNDDCWCGTGSTGPAADGRVGPSFAAYYDSIGTTSGSSSYSSSFGGTSGATPIVNGLAGVVQQVFTDGHLGYPGAPWQNRFDVAPNLTTTRVLLAVATRQLAFNRATRVQQGWGLPNVQDLWDNRDKILVLDEEDVLQPGQSRSYWVWVRPNTDQFRASMHHLEDEAVPFANPTRINSLDLSVRAPDGSLYWGNGNGILTSEWSTPGGNPNDVDIHENVFLKDPAPGIYEVNVRATAVRADSHKETPAVDADFALAVRGIGGGRDKSGTVLDVTSNAPGQLQVALTNLPGGWASGLTLMSFATHRHPALGNLFGLEFDDLTGTILSLPATPGDVFSFTNSGNPNDYPNAPYSFPAPIAVALTGRTIDAVALLFGASGIVDVSNVDRVTVQ